MIGTTLIAIRATKPCGFGWRKLLKGLGKIRGDDEPISFVKIVEISGIEDALFCCESAPQYNDVWKQVSDYICKMSGLETVKDPWADLMWFRCKLWAIDREVNTGSLERRFLKMVAQ